MDYEKKYKEAIELMKDCIPDADGLVHVRPQEIFPELKESEDERIRKALYLFVEAYGAHANYEITREEMLAWLEKQGQDGKVWFYRDDYVRDKKQAHQDGIDDVLNNPQKYGLEKQGEQKPVIEMKTPEESLGIDSETYNKIVDECVYGEQKPAWTPMDEQHVENLLAIIEGHGYPGEVAWLNSLEGRVQSKQGWSEEDEMMIKFALTHFRKAGATEDSDIIKWLESLKDRVQPQPKQEWSNWDKTIIESIEALCDEKIESVVFQDVKEHVNDIKDWLKFLKGRVQPKQEWSEEDEKLYNDLSDTYFYNDEDYPEETYKRMLKRVLDWMNKRAKSIRPQSTWKPSDEQMTQLKRHCPDNRPLTSLYEQLKKLREE